VCDVLDLILTIDLVNKSWSLEMNLCGTSFGNNKQAPKIVLRTLHSSIRKYVRWQTPYMKKCVHQMQFHSQSGETSFGMLFQDFLQWLLSKYCLVCVITVLYKLFLYYWGHSNWQ
jgi:hypothetical protein